MALDIHEPLRFATARFSPKVSARIRASIGEDATPQRQQQLKQQAEQVRLMFARGKKS